MATQPNTEAMALDTATFDGAYLVWRKKGGRRPRHRHATESAAIAEATRLSAANSGATFVVVREIARVKGAAQ